ncbi:MAG: formylmethanofuran dehydrogenase subunit C [Gammaproteobacteria bacterium RBG_16_51_14]|nr:MAG: formylmethanofuran dehydrogenase subunit C [Gammaproteobacteria bacterium RBG_16_51_14]
MTPLTFELKINPGFPLDISPLIPDLLSTQSKIQIKSIPITHNKEKIPAAELFTITGNDHKNICIHSNNGKLYNVGQKMSFGTIEVKGDVGDFLGQEMQGGYIKVHGNARAWAGCSMTGGRIDIAGDTGDHAGAGIPGDAHGMSKGMIYISGNAGDRVGDRMRRGIIIIGGKAGNYCGSRMYAGTIIVLDKTGKYAGVAMKRGTIILAKKPAHIYATFESCGIQEMEFLRLLFTQLSAMGKEFSIFGKFRPEAHRYSGDHSRNGKGEILIL